MADATGVAAQVSPAATVEPRKGLPLWMWLLAAVVAGLLTFWNLGHYGLWDDEADTALFGQTVWRTGDMDCRLGSNIITIYDGITMVNFRQRYMPPLQYYLAAPFVGTFPSSALAARLPFAILGFALVLLMLQVARRHCPDRVSALFAIGAILTLVPLFLFVRQCRYYAPMMLVTAAIIYLYSRFDGRKRSLAAIAVLLWVLLITHYLAVAALLAVLAVDQLLCRWRRQGPRFTLAQLAAIALPVVIAGAPVVLLCNPFGRLGNESVNAAFNVKIRLQAIRLYLLEANANCIYCLVTLVLAVVVARLRRDLLLARAVLAIVAYTVAIALVAKGTATYVDIADRYLIALLPLTALVNARVLWHAWSYRPALGLVLAAGMFLTNAFSLEWIRVGLRCHLAEYVVELARPPQTNINAIADFVKTHIPPGATIDVNRSHHLYPLMFHAPQYVYTGQLSVGRRAAFPGLDAVHFRGETAPDYVIRSGPDDWNIGAGIKLNDGRTVPYRWFGVVPTYIVSSYRPTHSSRLYFRSSAICIRAISDFVHIYVRDDLPVAPTPIPPEVMPYVPSAAASGAGAVR
jgi:4-amino-4-deoxy-L-arabinose transferase-like glycosyltransferase